MPGEDRRCKEGRKALLSVCPAPDILVNNNGGPPPKDFRQISRDEMIAGLDANRYDAVVIVGSDFTDVGSTSELGYNARIAANLGAPVLVVLNGRADQGDRLGVSVPRTPGQLGQLMSLALTDISHQRAELFAVITNRADPARLPEINAAVHAVVAE